MRLFDGILTAIDQMRSTSTEDPNIESQLR